MHPTCDSSLKSLRDYMYICTCKQLVMESRDVSFCVMTVEMNRHIHVHNIHTTDGETESLLHTHGNYSTTVLYCTLNNFTFTFTHVPPFCLRSVASMYMYQQQAVVITSLSTFTNQFPKSLITFTQCVHGHLKPTCTVYMYVSVRLR